MAAVVLTEAGHDGRAYGVTGGESVSMARAAEVLSEVSGRPVTYRDETLEEAYASRASSGAPDYEIEGWVTSYVAVANGELDVVTDVVPELTGHPAQTLPEFLAANPDSYAHLRA